MFSTDYSSTCATQSELHMTISTFQESGHKRL
jgi:hypothetical protein